MIFLKQRQQHANSFFIQPLAPQSLPGRVLKMAHRAIPNLAPKTTLQHLLQPLPRPAPYTEHLHFPAHQARPHHSAPAPLIPLFWKALPTPHTYFTCWARLQSIAPFCLAFSFTTPLHLLRCSSFPQAELRIPVVHVPVCLIGQLLSPTRLNY